MRPFGMPPARSHVSDLRQLMVQPDGKKKLAIGFGRGEEG